nr:hypothetical protein BaRGS_017952 [Batillaria attramentaria]
MVFRTHFSSSVSWVWQYKDKDGANWKPYKGDVEVSDAVPDLSTCYSTQTSSVTFKVSMDTDKRQYRCFVRHDGKGNGDKSHPAISDGMRLGMGIVARVMVLLVASFVLIIVLVC